MAAKETNPGTSLPEKWTNEKCIELAFSDQFPCSVKDVHVQKDIINRYLNFYLGGKIQKGLKVTDLAFAVISIMPQHEQTETLIWEDKHYEKDGTLFCLTPDDNLRAEAKNIANKNNQEHSSNENNKANTKQDFGSVEIESTISDYFKQDDEENSDNHDLNIKGFQSFARPTSLINKMKARNTDQNEKPNTSNHSNFAPKAAKETNYTHKYNAIPKFPSNLQWFSRCPDKKLEQDVPQYGPVENCALISSCNKLLETWDTNAKGRIVLKYLFGIIALITMRATTKKYTHLVNTFRSKKFLTHIAFANTYVNYSIPHKRFVKHSYRTFSRRDGKIPVMFAKIVVNSFHIDAIRRWQPKGSMPKLNVFKLTVLSHTVDYGFGLVTMLQNIQTKIGDKGIDSVLKATYMDLTAESWNKLLEFLDTYMADKSKQAAHHWARVLNTKFFEDLTCANNYALSVILSVFIEKLANNPNIWQSAWVAEHPENIEELKDLGCQMFKKMSKTVNLATLIKESESKMINKDKPKRTAPIFQKVYVDDLLELDNIENDFDDDLFEF